MSWIKLDRKMLDWEWMDNAHVVKFWIVVLLRANTGDREWKGVRVPRGSMVTSYDHLAAITGMSKHTVMRIVDVLIGSGCITYENKGRYSILSIINYDRYQAKGKKAVQNCTDKCTDKCTGKAEAVQNCTDKCTDKCTAHKEYKNKKNNNSTSTNTLSLNNKLTPLNNPLFVVENPKFSTEQERDEILKKRAGLFYNTIVPFVGVYGKKMCRAFYDYWTEPNKSHTKMRFEMERTWDIARRLGVWNSHEGMRGAVKAEPVSKFREAAEQAERMAERMDERERMQREQENNIDYEALRQLSKV